MDLKICWLLLTFLLGSLVETEGSRILFLIPLTTKSEKQTYIPLIDALSKRGHDVVVSSVIKSKYESKTIREFVPLSYDDFIGEVHTNPIKARKNIGQYSSLTMSTTKYDFLFKACDKVYENREFKKVINEKFDLVFSNYFFGQCFDGVLYKIGAPYIYFNTMIPISYAYELTGASVPASFVPFPMGPARTTEKMSFYDRMENALLDIHYIWYNLYLLVPVMENVYRRYLGQDLPGGTEIKKNVSLVYSNSHFTLNAPAPVLPDVIEVAGMHCRPAKPLPKDLDEFLNGAKDGFIYFSMGTLVHSKSFPEYLRNQFLEAFSKLKQRVLWKFEADFHDLPPNVKISKWLPQQDVLGHPNIKLFITQGGALSTQESIYHGVPVIALPIYADQNANSKLAANKGYAIELELLELDGATLGAAINKMLTDPSYTKKAKEISSHLRDQPISPLDKAVFWAEYVIRHQGTKHLQSSARQLNFFEYYLLDVIAFLSSIVLLILLILFLILTRIYSLVTKSGATIVKKHQ